MEPPVAAALASAEPPGGARSPSSYHWFWPGLPPWLWFLFVALTPTMTLRLVGGESVARHSLGRPGVPPVNVVQCEQNR